MARFFGQVGYATRTQTAPGVMSDSIVERSYYGKYLNQTVSDSGTEQVHPDRDLSSRIAIVADAFARGNYRNIKYVRDEEGVVWEVTSRQLKRPRLILSTGGVYSGRTAEPTP
jgi:hypothetical protein